MSEGVSEIFSPVLVKINSGPDFFQTILQYLKEFFDGFQFFFPVAFNKAAKNVKGSKGRIFYRTCLVRNYRLFEI